MNTKPLLPIKYIGETNWIQSLSIFLESHDVEVVGLSDENLITQTDERLCLTLPQELKDYYKNFGGIESSDFMYNLKSLVDYEFLSNSSWEFVLLNFKNEDTKNYIVFSESPGNDPLCFNKNTGEIYLFSHDPIIQGKVFKNFNDYLLYEIIEIQKLFAEVTFANTKEETKYKTKLLDGDGIDLELRYLKF